MVLTFKYSLEIRVDAEFRVSLREDLWVLSDSPEASGGPLCGGEASGVRVQLELLLVLTCIALEQLRVSGGTHGDANVHRSDAI